MIEKILSVKDEVGLHARPASLFVKLAQEFDGTVLVKFKKLIKKLVKKSWLKKTGRA